jgi:poly(A) polymerase
MLKRYKIDENGKRMATADIYTALEHGINNALIDKDAVRIIERLKRSGFDSYIVGGAVRDLLVGKLPKDFDIATAANPKQIRKLFWNSRIIGRRFKLAHIYFQDKIFEVSTFRSADQGELGEHNVYGTIEEDAKRRDFTVNSFYYDPLESQLLDFQNAMYDIKHRKIRSIIPHSITFIEDPVRMIRCIKYAVSTGFSIPYRLHFAIRKYSVELKRCSSSRMTEELLKILQSGNAAGIIEKLIDYRLFSMMLPYISEHIGRGKKNPLYRNFMKSLSELDQQVREKSFMQTASQGKEQVEKIDDSHPLVSPAEFQKSKMLAYLVDPFIVFPEEYENSHELFKEVFKQVKEVISPLTPPNFEVEKTVVLIFNREQIKVPRSAVRKPQTSIPMHQRRRPRNSSSRSKIQKNYRKPEPEGTGKSNFKKNEKIKTAAAANKEVPPNA